MEEGNNIKLAIKINYTQPIEIIDLTIALNSLTSLYQNLNNNDKNARLFVKEMRQGSLVIDLITNCWHSSVPIITSVNSIIQFCHYIKVLMLTCLGKNSEEIAEKTAEYGLPVADAKSIKDFANFSKVIKSAGDNCSIQAESIKNSQVFVGCNFNGTEAEKIRNNAETLAPEQTSYIKEKQLFRWVQANFNNQKTGNRGIISNIYKEPIRVIFDNNHDKMEMTSSHDDTDWQKKYYIVDVEILCEEKRPRVYKILKNHTEECFVE